MKDLLIIISLFHISCRFLPAQYSSSVLIHRHRGSYVSLVACDINTDGDNDFLLTVHQPDILYLFFNQGQGTFRIDSTLPVNGQIMKTLFADVNADNLPDLITANGLTGDIDYYRNRSDGYFDSPVPLFGGYDIATDLIACELNNDFYPDLLAFYPALAQIVVFLNNGDETFSATDTIYPGTIDVRMLAAHLNTDNYMDIAVSLPSDSMVIWYQNAGNGLFGTPSVIDTLHPLNLFAIADLDNNSCNDLLCSRAGADTVYIYLNHLSGFSPASAIPVPAGQYLVCSGDADGNHAADLLSCSGLNGQLSLLFNTSAGSFLPADSIAVFNDSLNALLVAEINGDGMNDILYTGKHNQQLGCFFNTMTQGMITPVLCSGDNNGAIFLTVGYGVSPYQYSWSNGRSTKNITGLTAGSYSVTITDAGYQTFNLRFTVNTVYDALQINARVNPVKCDTSATIAAYPSGGLSPYQYEWSNGQTTSIITGLNPGTISLTVSDVNHCITDTLIILPAPPTFQFDAILIHPQTSSAGSIAVFVSGGTSPYSFAWNNGSSHSFLNGLDAGNYTVTVTDALHCTSTASYTLILNSALTDITYEFAVPAYPNPAAPNQPVTLQLSPSSQDYSDIFVYTNTGELLQSIHTKNKEVYLEGLKPGFYQVTVYTEKKRKTIKLVVE